MQIIEAKTTIDVHKRSGKKCIVYMGKFCVKVSNARRGNGLFAVQAVPLGEIWNHLTEEGWIPVERGNQNDFSGY